MWTPHAEYLALGATKAARLTAYRKLFSGELDSDMIGEIRAAANTGLALGSERFRLEVEQLTRQRQRHLKRGPKRRSKLDHEDEFLL